MELKITPTEDAVLRSPAHGPPNQCSRFNTQRKQNETGTQTKGVFKIIASYIWKKAYKYNIKLGLDC